MTKIEIVSGFLGAGKTTLIKKLLKEAFAGEKLVLIENEFGEIGVDGGFLKEAGIEITEMNSGCICCSLVGDFGTALKEVLEKYSPDRVIIEPSGVGKLSDVVKAVEAVGEKVKSSVTVVDGQKCNMYMKNFGEFFNNQIENAGTIVISRTQKMKEDKLAKCVAQIKEKNARATIITTPWDEIDGKIIVNAMEHIALEMHHEHDYHHHEHDEHCSCGCHGHHHDHGHHHHADEVFSSWGVETPRKYTEEEIQVILKELSDNDDCGIILRAKGIVPCTDGTWLHFDMVPEEYELRHGDADYTGRICVIGSMLDKEELAKLFHL
jgi:G3E family GTPase